MTRLEDRIQRFLSVLVLVLIFMTPTLSYAYDGGVQIGEDIPHTLELEDYEGSAQSFDALVGEKGAILVFVRSIDWCPYCQSQLIEFAERAEEFNEKGYPVIAISYDSHDKQKKFASRYNADMTLLSDEGSEVIRAFGILNEDYAKGTFAYGVPHPVVYVVGKNKIIKSRFAEESYKNRPQIDVVLDAIE